MANFEKKLSAAESAIKRINDEITEISENQERSNEWIETLKKHKNIETLNRTAAVTLIRAVKVYENMCIEVILDCDDDFHTAVENRDKSITERMVL